MVDINSINEKVESFIDSSNLFLAACNHAFNIAQKDENGKISQASAINAVEYMFDDMIDLFKIANINLKRPTVKDLEMFLEFSELESTQHLDDIQFYLFYREVVKTAAIYASNALSAFVPSFVGYMAISFLIKLFKKTPCLIGLKDKWMFFDHIIPVFTASVITHAIKKRRKKSIARHQFAGKTLTIIP